MTSESDEQASKVILLALADDDNDHAFQQDLGLGLSAVFNTSDAGFRGRVLARLFRIFRDFEKAKLFKLDRTSIRWSRSAEGESVLTFRYVNLESDEPATFNRTFTAGSGG